MSVLASLEYIYGEIELHYKKRFEDFICSDFCYKRFWVMQVFTVRYAMMPASFSMPCSA